MHAESLNMLLGVTPVPVRLYMEGTKGATVKKTPMHDRKSKRVTLTDEQKEKLEANVRKALVGRENINALDLHREFIDTQIRTGEVMIPLDESGEIISAFSFRDFVNNIRNPCPERRKRSYIPDNVAKKWKRGLSVKEIASDMSITTECVRINLRKRGLYTESDKVKPYKKYNFDGIEDSEIFEFPTLGEAKSCRNAAYALKREGKKFSASVIKEGDVFLCQISVKQLNQEKK